MVVAEAVDVVVEAVDVVVVAVAVDVVVVAVGAAVAAAAAAWAFFLGAAVAFFGAAAVTEAAAHRGVSAVCVESMHFFSASAEERRCCWSGSANDPANCLRDSPFATCPHHRSATRKQTCPIYHQHT
jgi:hypothetical protein